MANALINTALAVYNAAWKGAIPLLKFNHRLRDGWEQRTLSGGLPARAHLWIQAASGGEAFLAWEVLKGLKYPFKETLRVLVTTNTLQGYETLCRAADEINAEKNGVAVQPWYFPFDAPDTMDAMMRQVRPKAAVILETEIWPGFLNACKKHGVSVLLANGRMTSKSLGGYLTWPGLFRTLGPDRILAISEADGRRFSTLFGRDRVEVMPNIKFDRMGATAPMARKNNPLKDTIAQRANFVVFGSIRKEEENEVKRLAAGLMREKPSTIIGLFPRHMHRVENWTRHLEMAGLTWTLRSKMSGQAKPGTVIVWDTFGELVPAYALAKAAFVGGSLAPVGGQNFLEPLTSGVTPVIGPHWKNFAWVGREIVDLGLAIEVQDRQGVLAALLEILNKTPVRKEVSAQARAYIRDRRGGAKTVCKHIADFLNNR